MAENKVEVRIEGGEELIADLSQLDEETKETLDIVIQRTALQIERSAKINAPVDTGRLRSSIHAHDEGFAKASVSDGVEYGVFQEYGTSRMKAHPFFRPAVNEANKLLPEALKGKLEARMEPKL